MCGAAEVRARGFEEALKRDLIFYVFILSSGLIKLQL